MLAYLLLVAMLLVLLLAGLVILFVREAWPAWWEEQGDTGGYGGIQGDTGGYAPAASSTRPPAHYTRTRGSQ